MSRRKGGTYRLGIGIHMPNKELMDPSDLGNDLHPPSYRDRTNRISMHRHHSSSAYGTSGKYRKSSASVLEDRWVKSSRDRLSSKIWNRNLDIETGPRSYPSSCHRIGCQRRLSLPVIRKSLEIGESACRACRCQYRIAAHERTPIVRKREKIKRGWKEGSRIVSLVKKKLTSQSESSSVPVHAFAQFSFTMSTT